MVAVLFIGVDLHLEKYIVDRFHGLVPDLEVAGHVTTADSSREDHAICDSRYAASAGGIHHTPSVDHGPCGIIVNYLGSF